MQQPGLPGRQAESEGERPAASTRVVLAEQDPAYRILLRALLALLLHDRHSAIVTALDRGEAVRLARGLRPDLIVLDRDLPGGGYDMLREIQRDPTLARVPALLLAEGPTTVPADLRVATVVPKPFRFAELEAAVQRALRGP